MADDLVITVDKLFSLVFIFTVTAINLWLIGNFLYWKNVFNKDKKCIITSITLSDLLIGLFSLPVEAALHFEIYLGGPGCFLSYVIIYSRFLAPFIYGIGITVLCMELILKTRGILLYQINKFLTLFISSVPWLLGVIVIMPLIYKGEPSHSCWYLPKNTLGLSIWSISTFLPIILFIVAWIATAFVKWIPASTIYSGVLYSVRGQTNNGNNQQSEYPANQSLMQDDRMEEQRLHGANFADNEINEVTDHPSNPLSAMCNPSDVPSCTNASHESQQLITVTLPPLQSGNSNSADQQATATFQENKDENEKRETLYLLMVILIFVTLTVPYALYNLVKLSSYLYGSNSLTSLRTHTALKWIHTSRSLFIPLLWSFIFHTERCRISSH